ncbi:Alginate_exp domain-containing protein [Candidatus Nitrotoga sp. HW29]|uniref:alginate export family protein n=1 Tax=Candidatus Nitrotoga sp. HW29 TaxID=2886963 RepID=UPI001EF2D13A|nr:alginate export family protein [Candidatus Nitrotoga sp. HW29]CAH1904012.1 Alginate_exp domain-containing protein [Candidatus Nitrotoga sp. HW29]
MKALRLHKKKTSRLRVVASLLAGTVLITPVIAFAQANEQELSQQQAEELDQKRRISERLQEIEKENAALKIKESFKAEASNTTAATPSYYVPIRSYGLQRETEPPRYVRQLNKTWLNDIEGLNNVDWVDLGLESRIRYEYRDNDFRRNKDVLDEPFLLRTRLYAAIKSKFDPFRATIELQDSRRFNSVFAPDNRDFNKADVIQGYGELYFKDALGKDDLGNDRPISVKVGRMAFELTDRRLIARNEWRNTTNSFQGLRATLGQQKSDWQADLFALQPLVRLIDQVDKADQAQWLYGAIGDWRKWSRIITLQPYYYLLQQNGGKVKYASDGALATASARKNREIHTAGLRGYGVIGNTGLDYDLNYAKQWGDDGGLDHDAYAYNLEAGYTAEHVWKPRLSASVGFASGDKNATDRSSQRFERLFGFARPWSNNDYIQMENIHASKVRVELNPTSKLKIDFGYNWYELASATDRWNGGANLRDTTGKSGKNIGEEFDIRVRYPISKYIGLNVGYAYFMAGDFTKKTSQLVQSGRKDNSSFLYVETSLYAF